MSDRRDVDTLLAEVRAGYAKAVELIRSWHGMRMPEYRETQAWELYIHSPEMKQVDAALAALDELAACLRAPEPGELEEAIETAQQEAWNRGAGDFTEGWADGRYPAERAAIDLARRQDAALTLLRERFALMPSWADIADSVLRDCDMLEAADELKRRMEG